jgi:hypothetical protein
MGYTFAILGGSLFMIKKWLKKFINEVISEGFAESRNQMHEEVASALHDVTYRINVLKEAERGGHRISTSDLNIATHMIDGYVFTNNSPIAGSVAWTDLNIVYKGITYTIANGNSALKYIWWQFSATDKTKLQMSNTKPTLTQDDILIGVNEGGTFTLTMAPGKMTPGSALLDGSVGSNELGSKAVTAAKIGDLAVGAGQLAAGAVTAGKIGTGAVNNANLFTSGVVDSTALGSAAVTAGKIATGAVNNSNLFTANVVDTNALKAGAVTSNELGSGAVTAGKLGTGAINNSNLFGTGVVNGAALGSGAVGEDKLNLATHFLF